MSQGLYDVLRGIAQRYMGRQRRGHTLQPTALVHEAYVKLRNQSNGVWEERVRFLSAAARAMRQVLVDHARRHAAATRGGGDRPLSLVDEVALTSRDELDFLQLDAALSRLESLDRRKYRVVELRFFGGLSVAECARALGVSVSTVEGDWRFARAWLRDDLTTEDREG
ncbi:MAG: ECF-type sigma factor [Planctomycetota bacterium]